MGPKGGRAKTAKKADGPGAKKAPSSKTKTSAARAGSRAAREKDVFVSEDADAYMKRLRRNFSNADDEDDAGDALHHRALPHRIADGDLLDAFIRNLSFNG